MIDLKVPFAPQISREKEKELLIAFKAGDRSAGNSLLEYHTALILREVSRHQFSKQEIDFREVFNAACLGFTVGLHKFDVTSNLRLSTYVMWWVKHYVGEEVSTLRSPHIKVPIQKQRELFRKGEALPKVRILSDILADQEQHGDDKGTPYPLRALNVSSEETMHSDGGISDIENEQAFSTILDAINSLPFKLRFIVRSCFFPRPEDPYKWNTVSCAKVLGISKEYSRQLRNKGLEQLKETLIRDYGITSSSDLFG